MILQNKKNTFFYFLMLLLFVVCIISFTKPSIEIDESKFVSHVINPKTQNLKFYWKKNDGMNFLNFQKLKIELKYENKELIFATNGGMYNKDFSPQGLYIENNILLKNIDTLTNGFGNFYLQPNGIFYINNKGESTICTTVDFKHLNSIKYATQSGPMLLIEGNMHPKFKMESKNVNIRNGVGILPDGNLIFAMSKNKINFYDFASFFKSKGCKNALYMDGFVSRTYLPSEKWIQLDGDFGVIIAEIKELN